MTLNQQIICLFNIKLWDGLYGLTLSLVPLGSLKYALVDRKAQLVRKELQFAG